MPTPSPSDIARAYFAAQDAHDLDAAVALWRLEVTPEDERVAVRWRARATFAGPGRGNGSLATGGG